MAPLFSTSDLAKLQGCSSCDVANAIETLGLRLRNEGFTSSSIRALFQDLPPVAGYAVTVKIKCSSPATDGHNYIEHTEWWNEILRIPHPRIVVIEDVDPKPGTGALVGATHAHLLAALGCVGVITNGAVRDLPEIGAMRFAVLAGNVSVSHAYAHLVEMGSPVTIAQLKIEPGDLLHADCHGVISIPQSHASLIPDIIQRRKRLESELIDLCRQTEPSIDALRAKVRELRNPV